MDNLQPLIQFLENRFGWTESSLGFSTYQRAYNQCRESFGIRSVEELLAQVEENAAILDEIVAECTVQETWLFRDPTLYPIFVRSFEGLFARQCSGQKIRILSAPCSSGEEVYSLRIALEMAMVPVETFEITGVDICPKALRVAEEGKYGRKSFREKHPQIQQRFFTEEAGVYRIRDTLREGVKFERANICGAEWEENQYEIIVTRNCLIYLTKEKQVEAIEALRRRLSLGGIIFVSPAEAPLLSACGLHRILQERGVYGFAARSAQRPAAQDPSAAKVNHSQISAEAGFPHFYRSNNSSVETGIPKSAPLGATTSPIAEDGKSVEMDEKTYLELGILSEANGCDEEAEAFYRKAIYLGTYLSEACLHLLLLLERRGEKEAAERLRRVFHEEQ